jgi:hypothetical protein
VARNRISIGLNLPGDRDDVPEVVRLAVVLIFHLIRHYWRRGTELEDELQASLEDSGLIEGCGRGR